MWLSSMTTIIFADYSAGCLVRQGFNRSPGGALAEQKIIDLTEQKRLNDIQTLRPAIREPHKVTEEAVFFVTHLVMMLADAVHRLRDPHTLNRTFATTPTGAGSPDLRRRNQRDI
jgi:hypothetical protein